MNSTKALVTLAVGDRYLALWKRLGDPTWRRYAAIHGYDVICLDRPLNTSDRAQRRSVAWQKCRILSQHSAQGIDTIG